MTLEIHNLLKSNLVPSTNILSSEPNTFTDLIDHVKALSSASSDKLYEDLRAYLLDIDTSSSIDTVYTFLDFVLAMSTNSLLDEKAVLLFVEDLMEVLTIPNCEKVFDYLEARSDHLIKDVEPTKGKGVVLLRLCNELMRRLSKTKYTVFCGRILIYLAMAFPVCDRSGVNSKGEFHVENVTFYQDVMEETDTEDRAALYKTIWSLQSIFAQPTLLFEHEKFEIFQKGFDQVAKAFELLNAQTRQASSSGNLRKSLRRHASASMSEESLVMNGEVFFCAKYLTGWNLFTLELKDVQFRRQLLIQFAITLQFCYGVCSNEQERVRQTLERSKMPTNRFVVYSHTFTPEEESWIRQARVACLTLVENSWPQGHEFSRIILYVMQMERNWIYWKLTNCPSFEKQTEETMLTKRPPKMARIQVDVPEKREWRSTEPFDDGMEFGTFVSDDYRSWKKGRKERFWEWNFLMFL